jgi:hypothetical protein
MRRSPRTRAGCGSSSTERSRVPHRPRRSRRWYFRGSRDVAPLRRGWIPMTPRQIRSFDRSLKPCYRIPDCLSNDSCSVVYRSHQPQGIDQLSHPDSRGEQQFFVHTTSGYRPPRTRHRHGPHAATMSSSSTWTIPSSASRTAPGLATFVATAARDRVGRSRSAASAVNPGRFMSSSKAYQRQLSCTIWRDWA